MEERERLTQDQEEDVREDQFHTVPIDESRGDESAPRSSSAYSSGRVWRITREDGTSPGPHKMHAHTVHLALSALLIPCTMCGTGTYDSRNDARGQAVVDAGPPQDARSLLAAEMAADEDMD